MDITSIIVWIVLGLVMGYLARAILPGEQKIGLIPTFIVGVVGSFLGGYVALRFFDIGGIGVMSLLAALIGAVVVLIIWCLIFRRRWN